MNNMKRRGQIFLILTILVVSFMIGITSVLLDVQRSNFINPAPDAPKTERAWELTVNSLEGIMDIYLAQSSTGNEDAVAFQNAITRLSDYLTSRGLSNEITVVSAPSYSEIIPTTDDITLQLTATFDIFIGSTSTTIDQTLTISLEYHADATQANTIVLSKDLNGNTSFLSGASFTNNSTDVINNGNGSYSHSMTTGQNFQLITPSGAVLDITLT